MILITGGHGELGSLIARELVGMGESIVISSRNPKNVGEIEWDLDSEFPKRTNFEINAIIHCAFDFDLKSSKRNIDGADNLSKYAQESFIPFINISSVLAEFSQSKYGKTKRAIEVCVEKNKGINLRIGVVSSQDPISNLKSISALAKLSPVLPFPGIKTLVFESRIESLTGVLIKIINGHSGKGSINAYVIEQNKKTLASLVSDSMSVKNRKILFFDIPVEFILGILSIPARLSPKIESIFDSFLGNLLLKKNSRNDIEKGWVRY